MTARTTPARDRVRVVWVTAIGGRVDHAVTAVDLAAGLNSRASEGVLGVCGRRFLAAPLVANPGAVCMSCARQLRAEGLIRRRDEWVAVPPSASSRRLAALLSQSPIALPRRSSPAEQAGSSSVRRDSDASRRGGQARSFAALPPIGAV